MIELTEEIVRKHYDTVKRLVEAKVTVKGHVRHSKTGKAFNVKQYERSVKSMSAEELRKEIASNSPLAGAAKAELKYRNEAYARMLARKPAAKKPSNNSPAKSETDKFDFRKMSDEKLSAFAKMGSRVPGAQKKAQAEIKRRKKERQKSDIYPGMKDIA